MRTCLVLLGLLFLSIRPIPAAPDDGSVDLSLHLERQTFDLINAYRTEHDLPALAWNTGITEIARQHSRDMATGLVDFGHGGFDDRMDRLRSRFTGMRGGGENVFESDDIREIAELAVATWLRSPPHLHNIRGDYTYSGLGIWRSRDGAYFFTQIFVKTAD